MSLPPPPLVGQIHRQHQEKMPVSIPPSRLSISKAYPLPPGLPLHLPQRPRCPHYRYLTPNFLPLSPLASPPPLSFLAQLTSPLSPQETLPSSPCAPAPAAPRTPSPHSPPAPQSWTSTATTNPTTPSTKSSRSSAPTRFSGISRSRAPRIGC